MKKCLLLVILYSGAVYGSQMHSLSSASSRVAKELFNSKANIYLLRGFIAEESVRLGIKLPADAGMYRQLQLIASQERLETFLESNGFERRCAGEIDTCLNTGNTAVILVKKDDGTISVSPLPDNFIFENIDGKGYVVSKSDDTAHFLFREVEGGKDVVKINPSLATVGSSTVFLDDPVTLFSLETTLRKPDKNTESLFYVYTRIGKIPESITWKDLADRRDIYDVLSEEEIETLDEKEIEKIIVENPETYSRWLAKEQLLTNVEEMLTYSESYSLDNLSDVPASSLGGRSKREIIEKALERRQEEEIETDSEDSIESPADESIVSPPNAKEPQTESSSELEKILYNKSQVNTEMTRESGEDEKQIVAGKDMIMDVAKSESPYAIIMGMMRETGTYNAKKFVTDVVNSLLPEEEALGEDSIMDFLQGGTKDPKSTTMSRLAKAMANMPYYHPKHKYFEHWAGQLTEAEELRQSVMSREKEVGYDGLSDHERKIYDMAIADQKRWKEYRLLTYEDLKNKFRTKEEVEKEAAELLGINFSKNDNGKNRFYMVVKMVNRKLGSEFNNKSKIAVMRALANGSIDLNNLVADKKRARKVFELAKEYDLITMKENIKASSQ